MRSRAVAVLLLLLPAIALAESQTWSSPAPVYPIGGNAYLRYDPLGNLYLLSQLSSGSNHWVFTIRPPGGAFGPLKQPTYITAVGDLRLGFDVNGNAVFAWRDGNSLKSAYRAAGPSSNFGTVQTVGTAVRFDLSVSSTGEALLAWDPTNNGNEPVKVARRPAGSATTFGAAIDLATPANSQANPLVVLDPSGSAVAVWSDTVVANPPSVEVQQVYRQAFHSSGSPELEFAPSTVLVATDHGPLKAENSSGRAVLVFSSAEDIGSGQIGFDIQAILREPGAAFGLPVSLGDPASYDAAIYFQAAMGPRGDAGVAWLANASEGTCAPGALHVGFAVAPPGASFAPSTYRGDSADHATRPAIAFDAQGVPLAVWEESIGNPCGPGSHPYEIRADLGLSGASFALSADGDNLVRDPAIARDGPGNAFAVWSSSDGLSSTLRGSAYDGTLSRGSFENEWEGWDSHTP